MTSFVATRNTCFAITSAIEEDFRSLILAIAGIGINKQDLLPIDVRETALKRRASDLRMDSIATGVGADDLLPYIDFADIAKILESKTANQSEAHKEWINATAKKLVALTPARNRVCHTRPLETEDLPNLVDFAQTIVNPRSSPFPFQTVANALARLRENPGFVLTLQIPAYWRDKPRVHNNLPIPEFDDTGFVGRHSDRMNVLKLLKSHYPVVTIVGEGGIGKTALALRCLYDILDDPATPYDAIVWVSLKTTALTYAGVREVTNAITSTLGLLSEVAKQLGMPVDPVEWSEAEYINEISEYLNLYKIIIAIDNLETISAGPLRELLLRVPSQSKLLLTSRVGVGEFEARYPLLGLDEKAGLSLFRAHVKILSVNELLRLDDGNIKGYCKRLFYNPLLLKWFVSSVGRGSSPGKLMDKEGQSYSEVLSFCFENLFDRLGSSERSVINCLTSARKSLTSGEIHFLLPELSILDTEIALSALHNSSIVIRSNKAGDGFEYSLSDSAAAFIGAASPPEKEFFKKIQERLRKLRLILTEESILESRYEYDPYFVRVSGGRDERICATYLRRALDLMRAEDYEPARIEIQEAKRLASQGSEVWRIAALLEENAGDLYKAVENYDHAVALDSKSRISKYCYGMFLMTDMDDIPGAIDQFTAAEALDPEAPPILTAKAMALNRAGRFQESAEIHEKLLPSIAQRERRWRLTGIDQAADCYRRWTHRDWEHKEYSSAKEHTKRALQILMDAAGRGDIDNKLLSRAAKVVNEALSKKELASDKEFTEHVVTTLELFSDRAGGASIPLNSEAAYAIRSHELSDSIRQRLERLDRSVAGLQFFSSFSEAEESRGMGQKAAQNHRMHGSVFNISVDKYFGFIACDDGSRWYFHAHFLKLGTTWKEIKMNDRVAFEVGQNSQGPCAIKVEKF